MQFKTSLRLGELLAKPISTELELTVRAYNSLDAANIEIFRELLTKEEKDLLEDPNFIPSSVNEIKEQLANFGLTLGMDLDDMDEDMVVRVEVIDLESLVDIDSLIVMTAPPLRVDLDDVDEDMDEYPDFDDETLLELLKKKKLPTV